MAEQSADLTELLEGIDRPRPLPPVLRHRLEGTLTGAVISTSDVATQAIGLDQARPLPPGLSDRLSGQILAEASRPNSAAPAEPGSVRLVGRWQRVLAGAAAAGLLVAAGVGIGLHSGQSSPSSTTASGPARSGRPASNSGGGISSGAPLAPTAGSAGASGLVSGSQPGAGPTSSTAAAAGAGTASSGAGSFGGPAPASAAAGAASNPSPAVQSLSPRQGPATGGTWVTVTGTHLNGATAVHFGTTSATQVVVEPNGQVRALSPAHLPGSVDVVVTTPAGATPISSADAFDFTA
ncbi:MAG: IPT/TIG domain-containing protein [Acidimicrobiales bacterium]